MKKLNKLLSPIMAGTILSSSLIGIVACGGITTDAITNQLVETSINEFKEFAKHPRESEHLGEIQQYLKNWITRNGWTYMQDDYGNIWFDVEASVGKTHYPKAILQGHMDMVFEYDKSQTVEGGGTKPVPKSTTHMIEIKDEKVNNRRVLHSVDNFTSIGADDGIGIAMIMALITNANVSHGPLRVIFTADEEIGLVGAMNLSKAALDGCDYVLNFDGESKANAEDMICTGCQGYCEYQYSHEFAKATEAKIGTTFQLEITGLAGGHCMDQEWIQYKGNGIANVGANADKMMLMVLNQLQSDGKQVQIESVKHYDKDTKQDIKFKANQMPYTATVIFNTDAAINDIKSSITTVINEDYKNKHPYDDWSKVTFAVSDATSSGSFLTVSDTSKLTTLFGSAIESDILEWEGNDEADKIAKSYPLKTSNISTFRVVPNGDKLSFTIGTRGCAGTNQYLDELKQSLVGSWVNAGFSQEEIETIKDYYPWDTSSYHKLVDFTEKAFKSFNVNPVLKKTRGGVEPAFFSTAKPGIEQLVIGPRIDNIHTPNETLYVDTIFNTMKAALIVIQTLDQIK